MAKEIERKFLIDVTKLGKLPHGINIKQAYMPTTDQSVVRIRIADDKAYLTLKGKNLGATRSEFEYEIPVDDAETIMSELCCGPKIDKIRYPVNFSKHIWEIDVFNGDNKGLIVAEVELSSESEHIDIPAWVTTEVTGDAKYYNSNLLKKPFKDWSN